MPIYALNGQKPDLPAPGTFWIAPDATIIGKVRIEEGASVWFGAVLRGDNEWITVGRGSNVQEHCTLHTDPGFPLEIGANTTIGHGCILHGCRIGAGALVGMQAVVLNGAVIAENSLVGAGALVTEGKSFPAGSLIVGSPAKAMRALDPEQIRRMQFGAGVYAQRWKDYAKGLERLD
ncbi:MAG: gamma carbonic anhydrase family protein [Methylobacteriaceae bacterium]|nr:gamma carbonic anhydrase family protein [Methylobacteriaceae bacterium]